MYSLIALGCMLDYTVVAMDYTVLPFGKLNSQKKLSNPLDTQTDGPSNPTSLNQNNTNTISTHTLLSWISPFHQYSLLV